MRAKKGGLRVSYERGVRKGVESCFYKILGAKTSGL